MAEFAARLTPSLNALSQTMTLLIALNGVIELRALDVTEKGRAYQRTLVGYYDNPEEAAKAAFEVNKRDGNLYALLNAPNPALLARANNRMKVSRGGDTTTDADVLRRSLLLIDCDPTRPSGIPATDEEKAGAMAKANDIREWLRDEMSIVTAFADSGNGAHALIRVDLPNTAESTALAKQVLEALDARFSDEAVHVDTKVYNAARITKAYGVIARKGDHTPDRPHRVSQLLEVPEPFEPVPEDKLREIAAMLPQNDPAQTDTQHKTATAFEAREWLERHDLAVQLEKDWQNGKLYVLEACPFNPEHRRSFHVMQWPSGNVSAACFHNSCKDNGWPQLRDLEEPGWRKLAGVDLLADCQRIVATGDANAIYGAIEQIAELDATGYAMIKAALPRGIGKRDFDSAVKAARSQQTHKPHQQIVSGLIVPEGYRVTDDATVQICRAPNGGEFERVIAYSPLTITARLSDTEEGLEYFRIEHRRARRRKIDVIERGVALDARKLIGHAASGFPVASDNAMDVATFLHRLEAANDDRLPCYHVASRLGWQGKAGARGFLLGATLIGPDAVIHKPTALEDLLRGEPDAGGVTFRGLASGDEQVASSFSTCGSFEEWRGVIGAIEPYPKVLAGFYASFVPPLLEPLGVSNFIMDFACDTSTGKTSALRVAGSPWGNPDERAENSVISSWSATPVAFERICSIRSHLPVLLDETKQAHDPRVVGKVLYMIGNGQGKGRGNVKGLQRTRTFRTVALSTGEAPATSFTQDGGTRTRCISIQGLPFGAATSDTRVIVTALNSGLKQHYGHAGVRFIQFLNEQRSKWPEWKQQHRQLADGYASGNGSGAARVADYVAAIVLAGRLAHEALALPWEFRDPFTGALWEQITAEVDDAAGAERALVAIKSWADSNAESFYGRHIADVNSRPRVPSGGWAGRWEAGEDWEDISFFPHKLDRALTEAGYDPTAIKSTWDQRGWLQRDNGGRKFVVHKRVHGDPSWVTTIKREAFDHTALCVQCVHEADTALDTPF